MLSIKEQTKQWNDNILKNPYIPGMRKSSSPKSPRQSASAKYEKNLEKIGKIYSEIEKYKDQEYNLLQKLTQHLQDTESLIDEITQNSSAYFDLLNNSIKVFKNRQNPNNELIKYYEELRNKCKDDHRSMMNVFLIFNKKIEEAKMKMNKSFAGGNKKKLQKKTPTKK